MPDERRPVLITKGVWDVAEKTYFPEGTTVPNPTDYRLTLAEKGKHARFVGKPKPPAKVVKGRGYAPGSIDEL